MLEREPHQHIDHLGCLECERARSRSKCLPMLKYTPALLVLAEIHHRSPQISTRSIEGWISTVYSGEGILDDILSPVDVSRERSGEPDHAGVLRTVEVAEASGIHIRLRHLAALRLLHTDSNERCGGSVAEFLRNRGWKCYPHARMCRSGPFFPSSHWLLGQARRNPRGVLERAYRWCSQRHPRQCGESNERHPHVLPHSFLRHPVRWQRHPHHPPGSFQRHPGCSQRHPHAWVGSVLKWSRESNRLGSVARSSLRPQGEPVSCAAHNRAEHDCKVPFGGAGPPNPAAVRSRLSGHSGQLWRVAGLVHLEGSALGVT